MGDPERFYVKTDYSHGGTQPADQKKEPKLTASPDQLKTFVEGLKANFSLPKVKLSGVVLSKDHNQRGAEVKEHLSKRRGLEVLIVDIDKKIYAGTISDIQSETYSLQVGKIYDKGLHFFNNLKYIDVGSLFYLDIN
ncbi:MAG TPA: hypothetical protein VJH92_00585 [Candidatus Nanoarchaeia archaeon]|nr:hypothetical protein [Candidatus Nanoarchaeia archaeon]